MILLESIERSGYTYHIIALKGEKEIYMLDVDLVNLLRNIYPSICTVEEIPISEDGEYIVPRDLLPNELAVLNKIVKGSKSKLTKVQALYSYTECITLSKQVKDVRAKSIIESLLYPIQSTFKSYELSEAKIIEEVSHKLVYYTNDIIIKIVKLKDQPYYVFVDSLSKLLGYKDDSELIFMNKAVCDFALFNAELEPVVPGENAHTSPQHALLLEDIKHIISHSVVNVSKFQKWLTDTISFMDSTGATVHRTNYAKKEIEIKEDSGKLKQRTLITKDFIVEYKDTSFGKFPLLTFPGIEPVILNIHLALILGVHHKEVYTSENNKSYSENEVIFFSFKEKGNLKSVFGLCQDSILAYTYKGAVRKVGNIQKWGMSEIYKMNELFSRNDYEPRLIQYRATSLQLAKISGEYYISVVSLARLFNLSSSTDLMDKNSSHKDLFIKAKGVAFPSAKGLMNYAVYAIKVENIRLLKNFNTISPEKLYHWIKDKLAFLENTSEHTYMEENATSIEESEVVEETDEPVVENITSVIKEIPLAFMNAHIHSLTFIYFAKQIYTLYRAAYGELWYTPIEGTKDFTNGLLGDFILISGREKQFIINALMKHNKVHGLPLEDLPLITEQGIKSLATYTNQTIVQDYETATLCCTKEGDIYSVHWSTK